MAEIFALYRFSSAYVYGCPNVAKSSETCNTGLSTPSASSANVNTLLGIVFASFAVVAVLIIVVAAFNIVISQGDAAKVAKYRSWIIYAFVGLIVAILSEVLVSSVLGRL